MRAIEPRIGSPEARPSLEWHNCSVAVLAGVLAVAACAFVSFTLPSLFGRHYWLTSWDAKWAVSAARWVASGGLGTVYQANAQFNTLPGLFILLAPLVYLGDRLGFVMDWPFPLAHPSMWTLVGPAFFVLGATCVLGADYLADTLEVSRPRRALIAIGISLFVVVPTCVFGGHPEDLLALALSSLSLALLLRQRHLGAPLVLSVAVIMQPWAGLLIFILVAGSPVGTRLRSFIWAVALPGLCALSLLALDFKHAYTALFVQPEQGNGQHLPWWNLSGKVTVFLGSAPVQARVGSEIRSLSVLVAILAGLVVLRSPSSRTIVTAAATVLLARGVFETELFAWYLAPAAVFMALAVASNPSARRSHRALGYVAVIAIYGTSFGAYLNGGLGNLLYTRSLYLPAWSALGVLILAGVVGLHGALRSPTPAANPAALDCVPRLMVGKGSTRSSRAGTCDPTDLSRRAGSRVTA